MSRPSTTPDPTPVVVVTVAAPLDTVWQALRDRERIHHWHGWEADDLADEIDLIYFREATEGEDRRSLTLSGGDRLELVPQGESTQVRLTRAPVSDDDEWASYYDDITEGWVTFLHQLRFAVEHHRGEPRRTLFHAGEGAPPEPDALVSGSTWFRSDHQTGTRVPAWGDGLLVTAHIPAKNAAMAVLTTYGLDDDAVRDLDVAARAWWDGRPGAAGGPGTQG